MKGVIFSGPSLPRDLVQEVPGVEWRPPVRQGDVYRAALTRPSAIAIVDGYFEVTPTVWHKEILWAMAQGIHVYGAASIGALRAAELDPFGMRGVGRIYEMYRDGSLQDDDEVAVLHGPPELDFIPITDAMVNIRATVRHALANEVLGTSSAGEIVSHAKSLFYKERTFEAALKIAEDRGVDRVELSRFQGWLRSGRVDQKRLDAEAMLRSMSEHLDKGVRPFEPLFRFSHTLAWEQMAHSSLSAMFG